MEAGEEQMEAEEDNLEQEFEIVSKKDLEDMPDDDFKN